ncbi:MmgE/PrpD family protein [Knoellia sp. CPCC 206435]|uniref:MmgE/PrpD family protein n=1 Tax=Knoellia terrae TaxID=3404797 RepID=UPI003B436C03
MGTTTTPTTDPGRAAGDLDVEPASADAGATHDIAAFAAGAVGRRAGAGQAPDVLTTLVDTVAVSVAGMDTPAVRALLDLLEAEPAPGACRLWGSSLTVGASAAALVNGTAAHALDWDDASPTMPMHPAAVLLPALVAQAAQTGATTDVFASAYAVGSAVFRAVSEVLPLEVHYGRGWHNTSTTGRLAATAALATLTGLGTGATRHALGLAASMASGSLANFGTMTKPLHAGLAARDAVTAIALAQRGFTARDTQLESPGGFFALFGDTDPVRLSRLGEHLHRWEGTWREDWVIKRFPSCYATHRAIDAVLDLRTTLDPDDVASIEVTVHRGGLRPLLTHLPRTGLEGKFSLPYTVARALRSGHVRLADFTDEAVLDPSLRPVVDAVVVREGLDPDAAGSTEPFTVVTIHTHSGRVHTRRVDVSRGDARNPMSTRDLEDKAVDAFASAGWAPEPTRRLLAELDRLWTGGDLGGLQDLLSAPEATRTPGGQA